MQIALMPMPNVPPPIIAEINPPPPYFFLLLILLLSMESKTNVKILYLNIYGQTKLPEAKQYQIQDIVRHHKCDIVHLQEIDCDSSTFSQCHYLKNNFSLISNNSHSKYGTASLIKNYFNANNISFDTEGRVIMFNIGCTTFVMYI